MNQALAILDFDQPKPSAYRNLADALDLLRSVSGFSESEAQMLDTARRNVMAAMASIEARLPCEVAA